MKEITPIKTKLSCVIFDFDGTIADTIYQVMRICNKLSEEYKFRKISKEELAMAKDMTAGQLIKLLKIPRLKLPAILTKGKKMLSKEVHEVKTFPGIPEVIHQIRSQIPLLGILTSNSKENVEFFLQANELDVFDFISTIPKLSGKAKHLKAIMRTFNLEPSDLLMIGDEVRDVKAAKKAGVPVVAVDWGFNSAKALKYKKPEYLISKPQELVPILEKS
ncbi:MAG: HAD hydrolase-like protein [Bacteroidota bacterium]